MATILVVEDNLDILSLLMMHLKGLGHRVLAASDATVAVQQIREGKPDLLILDYRIPGGSGVSVMENLRNFIDMVGTPVIFISALPPDEIMKAVPLSRSVKFMAKPLELQTLSAWVATMLGKPS